MENLIDNIQRWLRRNKLSHDCYKRDSRERNMYIRRKGDKDGRRSVQCVFCKLDHWSDKCKSCVTTEQRKRFFVENKLCFNCASPGHRGNECCELVVEGAFTVAQNTTQVCAPKIL
jgi:hypothetical protein